jgi:hypothetical protein
MSESGRGAFRAEYVKGADMTGAEANDPGQGEEIPPCACRWVIVVVVAPALWIGIGSLRATALARDYFAQAPPTRVVAVCPKNRP